MNCQEIQKILSSYADEILPSEEKNLVVGHLTSCARCRGALADLRKAKALLGNLEEVEPPPWLAPKIMARVREENEQRAGFLRKLFLPFYIKVPIQAFTVILVGVIVFQVYHLMEPEKKVVQAPPLPSVLTEQKALKEEVPQNVSKPSEALAPQLPQKTAAEIVAGGSAETAPQSSATAPRELKKSRIPMEEDAQAMAPAPVEDKSKREVAGLAQTKAPEPVYEKAPEDAERYAVLADKKRVEEESGAPTEVLKDQAACAPLPMPCITVSVSDTDVAKKNALDLVKQVGGKEIETFTQGGTETITAQLPSEKIKELSEKLKTLGEIKSEPQISELPERTFLVRIEIIPR